MIFKRILIFFLITITAALSLQDAPLHYLPHLSMLMSLLPQPVLVVQLILEEKLLSLRGRTKPLPSFRMRAIKYPMSWWIAYR